MPDATVMIVLATVLIMAIGLLGYFTIRRWHSSRTATPQVPPEKVTEQWLQREARNAERHPFPHH